MTAKNMLKEIGCCLESGYITRSPCRNCPLKGRLPGCSNKCATLARLQGLLVGIVSCSNQISEYETYALERRALWEEQ